MPISQKVREEMQPRWREEDKARREYERARKEAQDEKAAIAKALELVRREVEKANEQERAKFEQEMAALSERRGQTVNLLIYTFTGRITLPPPLLPVSPSSILS